MAIWPLSAQISKDNYWKRVEKEMDKLLFENMLPVWYPRVLDIEKGGYFVILPMIGSLKGNNKR